ncbi:MAG TPA: protein kinase [Ktedonobacteraceae bacterium]
MTITRGQHLIGKKIGSYVLERLLGYGGSSAVFLAQDSTSDEKVAIKVFLPRSTMDVQMQKNFYHRFLREAEAASKLDHPHILSIYSYGQDHGLPYIIMPYMPGGTLSEYVQKHGPLSLTAAEHYLGQIASALDYAHEQGCVHCDVKPANILLDGAGNAMLLDFGIARLMQPEETTVQQSMKSPETLMGTPDYISPEQALGQPLDGRSDIYSLGVTLFFLLAGSPPFKAESSIAMALQHVHETPPPLGLMRADITPQIDLVVGTALAKWPEERYQTAGAFRDAFAGAVASPENSDAIDSADGNFLVSSGVFRRSLTVLNPVVRIKPVLAGSFKRSRTTVAVLLLLPLLLVSGATVGIIKFFIHSQPASPTVTISPSSYDILANDSGNWQNSSTYFFKNGQYTIMNTSTKGVALAFYGNHEYSNFRLSVTLSKISSLQNGADYSGVVFRASADQSRYYLFDVDASGEGGYTFYRYDGQWHLLAAGQTASILPGLGQHNAITVMAKGNTFSFFINGKAVGKPVTDGSKFALSRGEIGLCVESNSRVGFSHMYVIPL